MPGRGTVTRIAPDDPKASLSSGRLRGMISQGFSRVEDVVYVGLGLLLAGTALILLASVSLGFAQSLLDGVLSRRVPVLLDRMLLVVMIVEILYTVQVSFREHVLAAEPFLIVGLIATIRRILVITAEFPDLIAKGEAAFRNTLLELGLMTFMVVAFVASLIALKKRHPDAVAERS